MRTRLMVIALLFAAGSFPTFAQKPFESQAEFTAWLTSGSWIEESDPSNTLLFRYTFTKNKVQMDMFNIEMDEAKDRYPAEKWQFCKIDGRHATITMGKSKLRCGTKNDVVITRLGNDRMMLRNTNYRRR